MNELLLTAFLCFVEPGFPVVGLEGPPAPVLDGARTASTGEELAERLEPGVVLVWRHGSAFPAEAWPALLRFLEEGGSLLHLGGEPFTVPVVGAPGARIAQARTVSCLKALRLQEAHAIDVDRATLRFADGTSRTLPEGARAIALEPRLADTRDVPHEDGSAGARDAVVRTLASAWRAATPRPDAAALVVFDRLRGRFGGGRWTFWLLDRAPLATDLERLLAAARRAPVDLRVDPTFGCFHAGETPSVLVRRFAPRTRERERHDVQVVVEGPEGEAFTRAAVLAGAAHATARVPLPGAAAPGLYRVHVRTEDGLSATTGFWIFDDALFRSGESIAFDPRGMLRDGRPEPVLGMTVMSESVHRKFLFEPNAAEWDAMFAELAALDVNLVRTGVWTGYRKISFDPGVVDEAFLRALEAFYLCARSHGIPVLFTFFAFVPEGFGAAESPYFDPRALEGQEAWLAAVAARFASARQMLWDLINEPSFASPDKLWTCRPHGGPFEADAFRAWLRERHGEAWETICRARWRLLPGEPIGLPTDDDWGERNVMESHRPYRAKAYAHFAQDAFAGWAERMVRALRAAGSSAAVTVGQDEGGLLDRPSPLRHADVVDFTSIHTWWWNDALLFDALMAKAPRVPLLVSETGVMKREGLDGDAQRSPLHTAHLLERKIVTAFAGGAFGVVPWCYHVNPYMASDNEVAIGLVRVDGSAKPEQRAFARLAAFFARRREAWRAPPAPEVCVVVPHGDHFGPRNLQRRGLMCAVERLAGELRVPVQMVSEYDASSALADAKVVVLPATRGLSDPAWAAIRRAVEDGAHLVCSGFFETDDAGLPAERLGASPQPLGLVEPTEQGLLRFPLDVVESWYAAREACVPPWGRGRVHHARLPLEWATDGEAARAQYARVLDRTGVPHVPLADAAPGVLVAARPLAEGTLLVAANERSRDVWLTGFATGRAVDVRVHPAPAAGALRVPAFAARGFALDARGACVDRSHAGE